MIIENILDAYDHFKAYGLYLKTIKKPLMHGYFTDRQALANILAELKKEDELTGNNTTLYFLANKIKDNSVLPQNCFKNIPKGAGIKKEDIEKIKCLIIDIDPKDKKEKV